MLNRALQVRMVKNTNTDTDDAEPKQVETIIALSVVINQTIFRIGAGVCAYVVLDTVRKVVVEKASSQNLQRL